MSTQRARELWRHRGSGERYLVELEDGRVLAASGPLSEEDVSSAMLAYTAAAQGRSPAFTAEAAGLERRRDEFEREQL